MRDRCLIHRFTGTAGAGCRRCGFRRALAAARLDWRAGAPPAAGGGDDPLARVRAALRAPRAPETAPLAQLILRMNRVALLFSAAGLAAGLYLLYDARAVTGMMQLAAADSGSLWSIP